MNPTNQKDIYNRDGLIRVKVLDNVEVQVMKLRLETFISENYRDPNFPNWVYSKSYLVLRWIAELAFHPALIKAVAPLIGDDILLWDANLPLKPPESKGYFGVHQDRTYWSLPNADQIVTVWLAINDINLDNGGLRAIPGSHRRGQLKHYKSGDPLHMLRRGQCIVKSEQEVFDQNATAISLSPGQASIHHPYIIHGSGCNGSDQWRYGIMLLYISSNTTVMDGYTESALHIQGSLPKSGFQLDTMPDYDLSDTALEAHRVATEYRGAFGAGDNSIRDEFQRPRTRDNFWS
jgi:hypothetical protein